MTLGDATFYDSGLDRLGGGTSTDDAWTNSNWRVLLTDGYTFDPTHVFVADIDPGSVEVATSGYGRGNPGGSMVRTVNNTDHRIEYHCDDVVCGTPDSGADVSSAILFRLVSDDSDSILIACYEYDPPVATDGSAFTVEFPATGAAYTRSPP